MATEDVFASSVRSVGDLAGVYEHDGDTGFFYLYDTKGREGQKVLGSVRILSGHPDFTEQDVSIRWDSEEQRVGLFIRHVLWAVFDARLRVPYGGSYRLGAKPSLPSEAEEWFGVSS